eukprot:3030506-Rhodomonas_salina.1
MLLADYTLWCYQLNTLCCYAVCGTNIGYGATSSLRYGATLCAVLTYAMVLPARSICSRPRFARTPSSCWYPHALSSYALSGTDTASRP